MTKFALAIHGGCGVMAKLDLTEQEWQEARRDLGRALEAGYAILAAGGKAIDAVQAAVVVMEDSPHFNAGHGAALNENGIHELDASIMDGSTLAAGAVSAARHSATPFWPPARSWNTTMRCCSPDRPPTASPRRRGWRSWNSPISPPNAARRPSPP